LIFFWLGGDQKLWFWGLNIFALWQSEMVFFGSDVFALVVNKKCFHG